MEFNFKDCKTTQQVRQRYQEYSTDITQAKEIYETLLNRLINTAIKRIIEVETCKNNT